MKRNFFNSIYGLAIIFFFVANSLQAQIVDIDLLKGLKPRSIGPAGMSGRVTAIDVIKNQPGVIYIGSASGGVWKSTSGGVQWEPLFQDQDFASIGAITIDQNIPDIIWVGTGEGNPRNSQSSGNGVYKSIDAGKTWKYIGLENTRNIHRIILDPTNSDIVYVGAQGSAWGPSEDRGVFKSTDGGKTWMKILFVNDRTGIGEFIMDPFNPKKLFAAMWEFARDPWFFKSGGEGSGLYVSLDAGENWKRLDESNGLPKGELGKIGLAMSAHNSKVVYALVESKKNALYRSDDGGNKFIEVANKNIGGRPFYYAEIHADPENENRLYNLHTVVDVSDDGGKTFNNLIPYAKVHPDHHAWYSHPTDGSFLINGNDGGLAISRDRGQTWRFVRNLPLAQFYHINYDMQKPYNVYGGMQDNGSWIGPSMVYTNSGIKNSDWKELSFGDGFDVVPDRSNPDQGFSMSQQGNVVRYDTKTGFSKFVQPVHPEGIKLRFNWNAGIAADPFDIKGLYFGSQYLHKSNDRGDSWTVISPDLTTNDPQKQKSGESGGLTYDATGAENYTTIIAIGPSPKNKDIIWVGTDDGNLQLTTDGGTTWNNMIKNIKGVPEGCWIPQINPSEYSESEAFVVINDYRRDNWAPYVFYTKNLGKNWKSIVTTDQVKGYALSFVQDPVIENLYFLGTESGLYFSIDAGANWTKWTNDYPTVSTMDLKIHPRENDLIIGTFGRAAYIIDNIQPLREIAKNGLALFDKSAHLFPIPEAEIAQNSQPAGMHFPADSDYDGDNKIGGAMISYIAKPFKDNKDKAKFEIFDHESNLVNTVEVEPKDGINRLYWTFDKKRLRNPERVKPEKDDDQIYWGEVLPGKYKIKLTYNGLSDSSMVDVIFDHRVAYDLAGMKERNEMGIKFEKEIHKATMAADRLRDAQKIINQIDAIIKDLKGDEYTELKKIQKETADSLKTILERLTPKEVQGIFRDENSFTSQIRMASRAIGSFIDKPGIREEIALNKANKEIQKFITDIDHFFNNNWVVYKKAIELNKINYFTNFK
ncbi:MAG: hypothetical protein KKG99_05635 [Bacteroidetes bacterium]|nr:hypothetical protein [Bacteroidota bacterium]